MSLLIDSTIKVSLIVLIALAAQWLLRRQSAAVRHWVMAVAIGCAAVTPVVSVIAPSWHLGLNSIASSPSGNGASDPEVSTTSEVLDSSLGAGQAGPVGPAAGQSALERLAVLSGWAWFRLAGPIWLAGVAISVSSLLAGMARLASLASASRRIERGRLANLARETAAAFGLRRPVVILQSSDPALLAAWGLLRPKVILPAEAAQWSDARVRVVLRHELAHIQRGDWPVLVAAELLRAVYWFNPLVWMACTRVRQESECACDDAVLNAGVEGSEYATHLLDVARALTTNRRTVLPGLPASAMARRSSLEGRIRVMLDPNVNRRPLTQHVRVAAVVVLLGLTISIAGLGAQAFFTFTGSVFDATNRTLPDAKLILTNASSQAKHEVRSNRTGRFEFVGLPPGDYALEASIPGFVTFRDQLTVTRNVERTIELQVGSLEETITVTASRSSETADPAVTAAEETRELERRAAAKATQQATLDKCSGVPAGPMGGQIRAPRRLSNANPRYPENLRAAGIGGVVKMEALIGTDGNIQDVRVVESPHPDLESAAVEAVRQWQYTPTLLNCVPVEVRMIVTTRFNNQP